MIDLIRRLHIWVGLFNLTVLIVFAATGLSATFPAPAPVPQSQRFVDYEVRPNDTDKQAADDLYDKLRLSAVSPVPSWDIRRNDSGNLVLNYWGPNGVTRVTVLESEKKVQIEPLRNSIGQYLSAMHTRTFGGPPENDLRLRLWGAYVEVSIFSLMFMVVTGVWQWIATRPRLWWAQAALAAGACLFFGLWVITR